MGIVVTLDLVLAKRKVRGKHVAAAIGMTEQNFSLLRSGRVKGIRFDTLSSLCAALDCLPGDLLAFVPDEPPSESAA